MAADTSTTGGIAPIAGSNQAATVAGTVSGITVWQNRTGSAGEAGWGRVANNAALGVPRVVVMSTPFLNYSGGDVPAAQYASYAAVRAAQSAAATAESVAFFDLWAYQAALITAGVEAQNSSCWSYVAGNQHPNLHGTQCWALGLFNFLQNQPGWIAALS